jgi:hypothetical protein
VTTAVTSVRSRAVAIPAWAWLTAIVVLSVALRLVLERRMVAPWIMVDELIYSELAKSIAAHGSFLIRDVPAHGFGFLYPILLAPAFRVASVPTAYGIAKAIGAVVMSLAAVPAYALARRLVRPGLALVAALMTVAVPSMVYTGTLMTENAFYPLFITCGLVLVLVLERPTLARLALLLVLTLAAFLTRAQAVALVPAVVTAPLLLGRARLREFRLMYAGVAGGAVLVLAWEVVRGRSPLAALGAYRATTGAHYSFWSVVRWLVYHVGELDLYVGVVPFAALLFLAATRDRRTPFVAASVSLTAWLLVEVAAFASTQSQRIEERNMFFVAPFFFIALLWWIERGLPRPRAAAVCALVAAAGVGVVPYSGFINGNATSDTLALIPLWTLQDTVTTLDQVGSVVVLVAIALAVLLLLVPVRYALALPAAVLALYAIALWPIEANPHGGVQHASVGALYGGTAMPDRDWVDGRVGHGADVAVLFDSRAMDKFTVWTNEFFNRSIHTVAYTADPVPGGLPQSRARIGHDGFVVGMGRPKYVLTSLPLIGRAVARDRVKGLTVWRTGGSVPRLQYQTTGIYGDNWTGPSARIERHACTGSTPLRLRQGSLFTAPQVVFVNGRRVVVDGSRTVRVPSCTVEIHVPHTRIPGTQDPRELGIIVDGFS